MTDLTDKQKATIEKYAKECYEDLWDGGEHLPTILTRFRSAVRAEYREECGEPVAWLVRKPSSADHIFPTKPSADQFARYMFGKDADLSKYVFPCVVALPKEDQ